MNKYELMFIVRSDMEEAEIKSTAENMKKILSTSEAINEFERVARINENILRHLTIKVED